jgi:DNA-binding NarL/FixJ family response regulator
MRRASSKRRKKMKVVIADDSPVVVERLRDLLSDIQGVELVGQARDAVEALRCIRQGNPDLAILDLQMPGGSGLDILRTIRPERPGLCVLICTNYPYPQYKEQCLAAGANYFLDKSAEFEKIPEILRGLLKNITNPTPAVR